MYKKQVDAHIPTQSMSDGILLMQSRLVSLNKYLLKTLPFWELQDGGILLPWLIILNWA